MLHKTAHSLSPPPRMSNHMSPMIPTPNGQVVLVPYPPPPQHVHPVPHGPHMEKEGHRGQVNSPHHAPSRERTTSPSPSTSPRRHSSSHVSGMMPGSHQGMQPHKMHSQGHYHMYPGHYHHMQTFPVHPAYPVRPGMGPIKRESPSEKDTISPNDGRSYIPPGLIAINHGDNSEDMHRIPMMVEAHPPGPPLNSPMMKMPPCEGVTYHPVRRRGEAAAMVDIGHGMLLSGKLIVPSSFGSSFLSCHVLLCLTHRTHH